MAYSMKVFLLEFFPLTGPDLKSLKTIPLEPLVISCLPFGNVAECMSDFTFTQSKKKKIVISSWPCFYCCIKINYSLHIFKQHCLQDRLVRALRTR